MLLRSMLFIPGDSEKKLAKGDEVKADAIILDLEDSVAATRKEIARTLALEFLKARPSARRNKLFVRINPLDSEAWQQDLAAIMPGAPDGILLPKASGPEAVHTLTDHIIQQEARAGLTSATAILALSGESAVGVLSATAYAKSTPPRLIGLSWGPWDLAADLGAIANTDETGAFTPTFQLARSLTLLAAKAAGVQAIDTPHTNFKDENGLLSVCKALRRDGWNGKIAIHPAQVPIIHEGFAPTVDEVRHAEQVLAAFAATDGGVASLNGVMLDLPHLKQARRTMDLHKAGLARSRP